MNKKFKNMTLNELLESDLSLENIDDIIEWDYQVETKKESELNMANSFKKNDDYYCYGIREKTRQQFLSCTKNINYVEFGDSEVFYTDNKLSAYQAIANYNLDKEKHEVIKVFSDGRGDLFLK